MVVKNSSVDFVNRQMPETSKAETSDSASGFKEMLKNKHHETGTAHKETSHTHKKESAESEDAAHLHTNTSTQTHGSDEVSGIIHKTIGKKSDDEKKTDTDVDAENGVLVTGQACNLDVPLDVIYGKMQAYSEPLKESPNAAPQLEVIDSATGQTKLVDPIQMMDENQEVSKQGKSNEEKQVRNALLDAASISKALTETEESTVLSAQTGKTGEEQAMLEKEKKKSEEFLEVFQGTSHEPKQTQHIQSKEALTSQVIVKADNAEELEAKLAEQIVKHIHSGKNELEVQLDPKNLGKIHIKVSYEENQVSVSVTCSESKTMKMLSHSAGDLGNILESNIDRPVHIIVDKQESNYLNNQQEQGNGGQQQRQHQESRQEETQEDFLQKLRLGILETDSIDNSYAL